MVLVDTSVWIAHLRKTELVLVDRLREGPEHTSMNESGGTFRSSNAHRPTKVLAIRSGLDRCAQLLPSALPSHSRLWTLDKRLQNAASRFGLTAK